MSETDPFISQEQDTLIWEGFQAFRESPAWIKIKLGELGDITYVLERFAPAYRILKLP